jgi:hypothetical protein
MKIKELLTYVESQKDFTDWKSKNPQAQLVHVFILLDPSVKKQYDIGYYNPKTKKMVSFTITEDKGELKIREDEEILKDPEHKILPLSLEDISVELESALETAVKLQKEKYKKDDALKHVLILQRLQIGQVWNITFITKQFNTLNIKIDSKTGKAVDESLQSLFQFGAGKK